MKRMKKNILIILCMIVTCTVVSCNKDADKTKNIPIIKVTYAEVEFAYKTADRVYISLMVGGLPYDPKVSIEDENGRVLYKVTEGNIKLLKDVEPYLKTYFSDQIANEIVSKMKSGEFGNLLKEINGQLYSSYTEYNNLRYIDEIYTVTKENDYKMILHLKAELHPDLVNSSIKYDYYDFVYENLDGKKWVFTSFPFFR